MKNEMPFKLAESMSHIIRRCLTIGVTAALLLSMFSVMVDQIEFAEFLLRNVAVSIAVVCVPLLAILAIVKRINR